MLNFGARRLRASKLAGKTEIPAFEDEKADGYDQVIENEQREALRPIELALFVKAELASGISQAEIARRLGKSGPYINYVCALIDPPDWLMALYRDGKCRGVKELYDLRRLHEADPAVVTAWIAKQDFVARSDIASLRARCGSPPPNDAPASKMVSAPDVRDAPTISAGDVLSAPKPAELLTGLIEDPPDVCVQSAIGVEADLESTSVQVLLDVAPSNADEVFVTVPGSKKREAVDVHRLQAIRLVRRWHTSGCVHEQSQPG